MIHSIGVQPFRIPLVRPFTTSGGTIEAREGAIVTLTNNDGVVGVGEAAPLPGFAPGTVEDVTDAIGRLSGSLLGAHPDAAEAMVDGLDTSQPGLSALVFALDTALHDLRARRAGVAVAALLSESHRGEVSVNAVVAATGSHEAASRAAEAASAGFRCVKLKVGVIGSPEAELMRIAEVRRALGGDVSLRLDANGAWSVEDAIRIIGGSERYNVELVEQPVSPDDLGGMARVRAAVEVPIAVDEPVTSCEQARRVVTAGAADVLVIKLLSVGGLRRARAIVRLADEAGLQVIATTAIDSGIGVAATLHFAASIQTEFACGLATLPWLTGSLIKPDLAVDGGTMKVPQAPGLGVTVDESQLDACAGKSRRWTV
ncbi:MAG: o-succinylbenzoate synthase [Dehalococcoidia bacterium]|nr:o-succinylbenzoate synthase [Dehalococcoidia bacterium]